MERKEKYTIRFKTSTNICDVEMTEDQFYKLENNLLLGKVNHKSYIDRIFRSECIEEHRIIEFETYYTLLYAIKESIK